MEKFIKDGNICYLNQIIIYHDDGSYTCNVTKETALSNGWASYENPETMAAVEYCKTEINEATDTDNATALSLFIYYKLWNDFINQSLAQGRIIKYNDRLWRVRQDINTVLENQAPGIDTAALYERIDEEHEGTPEDPIPYEAPMEIFLGKIYTEGGIIYECTRNSETALTHNLSELVGQYVKIYEESSIEGNGTRENPYTWLPQGDGLVTQSLELDKYYIENGIVYKCIQELSNTHYKLSDLIGTYVETAA